MAYTKTLVSRNALSLIRFLAVEDESGRERTPYLAQIIQGALPALIAADFESAAPRDPNFDAVAFFQFERLDYRRGQADGQAVPPFRDSHGTSTDIHSYCISNATLAQLWARTVSACQGCRASPDPTAECGVPTWVFPRITSHPR